MHFNFNYKKGTQALNYFAIQSGGKINKMKALKLVYFADRYHLRKYGRLVTNDSYLAMEHGPVPSTTKDIAESNDYLDKVQREYSLGFIEPVNNLMFSSINDLDKMVLSKSDLEALKFAWDNFGKYDQFELRDLTHLYPEWLKHKDELKTVSCIQMDLMGFFDDPTASVNKCYDLNKDEKLAKIEHLTELSHIEALWR